MVGKGSQQIRLRTAASLGISLYNQLWEVPQWLYTSGSQKQGTSTCGWWKDAHSARGGESLLTAHEQARRRPVLQLWPCWKLLPQEVSHHCPIGRRATTMKTPSSYAVFQRIGQHTWWGKSKWPLENIVSIFPWMLVLWLSYSTSPCILSLICCDSELDSTDDWTIKTG